MGVLGLITTLAMAFALSSSRRSVRVKTVLGGLALQFVFALIVLRTQAGENAFGWLSNRVTAVLGYGSVGANILFGALTQNGSVDVSAKLLNGEPVEASVALGASFAFGVLPTIIFFSALSAILYHLGLLQLVVRALAWAMRRTMGLTGVESLSAAANVFLGQTESPLLIRPYLRTMSESEIMALMTGGFATIAGGVLAAFIGMLSPNFPDIARHLIAASVMSAPAALVFAKIMVPSSAGIERGAKWRRDMNQVATDTAPDHPEVADATTSNIMDAAARGTSEGLSLALNVGAMLIAFTGLIALLNALIGGAGELFGFDGLTLNWILGKCFSPLAWLLGVPWRDAELVGGLMGTKTVLNEFLSYLDLARLMNEGQLRNPKSILIATYALCGFSNFASIGIQLGGLTLLAPERRATFARLALRAMIAGSLACFETAAIAGLLMR